MKLLNMVLNTSWVKKEIKTETGKSLDLNENTIH